MEMLTFKFALLVILFTPQVRLKILLIILNLFVIVSIDGATIYVCPKGENYYKIPFNVAPPLAGVYFDVNQVLQHMKWLFQKSILGQDVFLLGYVLILLFDIT